MPSARCLLRRPSTESVSVLLGVTGKTPVLWLVLPCPPPLPKCSPHTHTPPTSLGSEAVLSSTDCPTLFPPHSAPLHLPARGVGAVRPFGPGSGLRGQG